MAMMIDSLLLHPSHSLNVVGNYIQKKMSEIAVVSDIWGIRKSEWFMYYQELMSANYEMKFYDSCALGLIDLTKYEALNIHNQFVEFGIQNAVNKLLEIEKKPKIYIGCSIGGVILWRAGLRGLPIKKLVTISSTRLRKEIEKPSCPVKMYFGESDAYKPTDKWFKQIGINSNYIITGNHDIYKENTSILKILKNLNEEEWIDLK